MLPLSTDAQTLQTFESCKKLVIAAQSDCLERPKIASRKTFLGA